MDLASIELALAALEARGAGAFDAASCECVRKLIMRAGALEARPRALLAARANEHVRRLAERFDLARAHVERRIDAAEALHGALHVERAALARGELGAVRRALRLRASRPLPLDASAQLARRERCANEYEASSLHLLAAFAVARSVDFVPEQAGPYHPLRIASDLLDRIHSVSPIYLNAQLRRLEELTSLLALPELPGAAARTAPRKQRAVAKGGSRA